MQRRSLAIWRKLLIEQPGNVRVMRNLFANHMATGDMLVEQKDTAAALQEYNEALAIAQPLADKVPSSTFWSGNAAQATDSIAKLRATASSN